MPTELSGRVCLGETNGSGAPGWTRTSTLKEHRPSTCRVYQFRHGGYAE